MITVKPPLADPALLHAIADLILSAGESAFVGKLTCLLHSLASFDDCAILIYHPSKAPVVLHTAFANPDEQVWQTYLQGAYLLSPFYEFSLKGQHGFATLHQIAPEDFYQSAYCANYFHPARLMDEACYVIPGLDQHCYLVSLGRTPALGRFTARTLQKLHDLTPIVIATVQLDDRLRHAERFAKAASHAELKERLLHYGEHLLTPREQEVMQLLIRGYSSKEAARTLLISPETERVHRKNIYAKLAVDSQRDLLSQLFDQILTTSNG